MGLFPRSASSAPAEPSPADSAEAPAKRDRIAGFSIILVAFSAALVISWTAGEAVKPQLARTPAPPTTDGLAGYPQRVDPIAALPLARQLSERNQLRRIVATGVGSDGTVDLDLPNAGIRYEFDSAMGEGPEPPRPPGTVRHGRYCGRQSVQVDREGIAADPDQPRTNCRSSAGEPLPEPRCTPQQIWARALEKGAPAKGRATIEYFRAQEGPAWRFSMADSRVNFTLFGDCERELKGKAARAMGP